MVTSTPSRDNTWAQDNPAGPAPTIATLLPFDGLRRKSGHFCLMAISVEYRCKRAICIGSSSIRLYTQAPSHSFSTGQTFEHPPPIMLDEKIVCAEPLIFSVAICLINLGPSMLVGHDFMHGAS